MVTNENRSTSPGTRGRSAGGGFRSRHAYVGLAALTLASLAVRMFFFRAYTLAGSDCDGAAYMDLARNIAGGSGWVTNSLRFLFLLPPSLPQPDAHWSPLYPLLTSWSFAAFGPSFTAAKVVPLVFGALVPAVVCVLTAIMTRSRRAALIAGVVAVFHPTLVTWSLRIETEILSVFFVGVVFALLFDARASRRPYWLGLALGLAYLAKYQSVLLWAPVVCFYAISNPWRVALRRLAVAAAVFVAVILPWLIRNALVFGSPVYTDLSRNFISYYPEFGGEPRYLSSLTMPVSTFAYLTHHTGTVLAYAKTNLRFLMSGFLEQNRGSLLLVPFVLPGLVCVVRAWREWASALLFAGLLMAVISISIPQVRYAHVLIPFWIVLVAAGAGWLLERVGARRMLALPVTVVLLVALGDEARLAAHAARDTGGVWTPSANYCALEAQAAADFIQKHTLPSQAVFAPETFHYALLLDRNAIQIPFDEDALLQLARRYDVRYMVITARDLHTRLPQWEDHLPAWAELVDVVSAPAVPRPAANPHYSHVSEVRVYRLTTG